MTMLALEMTTRNDRLAVCRREEELPQLLAWIAKSRAEREPNSPGNCQIWQSGKALGHRYQFTGPNQI
jgi:hypothetical protein